MTTWQYIALFSAFSVCACSNSSKVTWRFTAWQGARHDVDVDVQSRPNSNLWNRFPPTPNFKIDFRFQGVGKRSVSTCQYSLVLCSAVNLYPVYETRIQRLQHVGLPNSLLKDQWSVRIIHFLQTKPVPSSLNQTRKIRKDLERYSTPH